jgi:biopolymer transport protein ExbD
MHRHAISAEPNVTPMIDVLLVLLIVFMVMVVKVHHTLDVQLPQPQSGPSDGAVPIVLEVLPGPAYRINTKTVDPGHLGERLAGMYRDRPEKIIQIAGDPKATYKEVATAIDVARSAGVRVVGIVPRPESTRR